MSVRNVKRALARLREIGGVTGARRFATMDRRNGVMACWDGSFGGEYGSYSTKTTNLGDFECQLDQGSTPSQIVSFQPRPSFFFVGDLADFRYGICEFFKTPHAFFRFQDKLLF